MENTAEFKAAMQELINANLARVEAMANRDDALNVAIARQEIASRNAIEMMEKESA